MLNPLFKHLQENDMNILLINQYSGNKGDRAVLYAFCQLLKSCYNGIRLTVSTSDSTLWNNYKYYQTENITFIPWGWDYNNVATQKAYWKFINKFKKYTFTVMREAYLHGINISKLFVNPFFHKAVTDADCIISVGGHHFTTILSRDLVCGLNFDAMSVLMNKPLICFSQSFGPFTFFNKRNLLLTKKILTNSVLMPREQNSLKEINKLLTVHPNVIPTYESVLTLSKFINYKSQEHRNNIVGISIYCAQKRTEEEKEIYQTRIALFCDYVIGKGFDVKFFPMEMKGSIPDDRPFIKEIITKISNSEKCSVYDEDLETEQHLNEVSKCKVFLGHKTHSTIFALATGTPLIALAYHPKTIEFLNQFDLASNAIEDDKLSDTTLCEIFDKIVNKLEDIGKFQYDKSRHFAIKIEKDLKKAIELIL